MMTPKKEETYVTTGTCKDYRMTDRWMIGIAIVIAMAAATIFAAAWVRRGTAQEASALEIVRIGTVQEEVVQDIAEIKIQVKRTDGSIDEILGYVRRGDVHQEQGK